MDFSFFTTDNKSGYKTREKWFEKNHPQEYQKIINYCSGINIELSFKEKILFYFKELKERPKCITCGKEIKFRDRLDKPYGEFCSLDCINNNQEEMIQRQKNTFKNKYGVEFYPQHEDFLKKQRKTKLDKYGDENYNNNNKAKETKKIKYGDENYVNTNQYKITCFNKYGSENYSTSNSYKNKIISKFKEKYLDVNFTDIGKMSVTLTCAKCNQESEITKQLLYERYKRNYEICTYCNPIGQSQRSGHEIEISDFLKLNNIEHEVSNRELIGKELDVYVPSKKIAIEVNGLYWHNELFLISNYHLNKTIKCQEKNVDLLHIFEDEWLYKKEIVKSIINNKIGVTSNKIYGRKCVIKEIDAKTCEVFLNNNHIQGNVKSKVRVGLFYEDNLVSVMTFSKGRVIMGGKDNEWELTRFSNLINTNVIGAASKLFNFFIKKNNPDMVISYSDVRLFNGGMYNKLGFIKKSQSAPNYWYVINNMRYYRFNFRKSQLVKDGYDKNKTEKEIMFDRKIYRIYDCGHIRWEYNSQKNK
jgi:hypothetical protein